MNILISTTSNWNPGDDFIRYGVKNLLTPLISEQINWIHYDRNPDYFTPGIWEMGANHKSNIMNNPINWDLIDAVVLAGSPEFLHGPLKPLYEGLANHPEIPLLAIGVGYSFSTENLKLTDSELWCLNRDNTLIITRQYDLQESLQRLLTHKVHCLPCPALFALNYTKDFKSDRVLCIPQSTKGPQAIDEQDRIEIQRFLSFKNSDVLCHYIKDLEEFGGYFSTDAKELLTEISKYSIIFTNRLHGGIVALGAGADVKFINSSNRVQKALEPYLHYKINDYYKMFESDRLRIRLKYENLISEWLTNVK